MNKMRDDPSWESYFVLLLIPLSIVLCTDLLLLYFCVFWLSTFQFQISLFAFEYFPCDFRETKCSLDSLAHIYGFEKLLGAF